MPHQRVDDALRQPAQMMRRLAFGIAVVLGTIAVWLIVTGTTQKSVQIGVLCGLWGLLLAAFSVWGTRHPHAAHESEPGQELHLRPVGEIQTREAAAERRAYEYRLEEMLRRQIQATMAAEVASLRAEVSALRNEFVEKVGSQLRLERIETTRLIGSNLEALQQEVRQVAEPQSTTSAPPARIETPAGPRAAANALAAGSSHEATPFVSTPPSLRREPAADDTFVVPVADFGLALQQPASADSTADAAPQTPAVPPVVAPPSFAPSIGAWSAPVTAAPAPAASPAASVPASAPEAPAPSDLAPAPFPTRRDPLTDPIFSPSVDTPTPLFELPKPTPTPPPAPFTATAATATPALPTTALPSFDRPLASTPLFDAASRRDPEPKGAGDPFASMPRLSRFTEVDPEPPAPARPVNGHASHRYEVNGFTPEPSSNGNSNGNGYRSLASAPAPTATGGRRRRAEHDSDDVLSRILEREGVSRS